VVNATLGKSCLESGLYAWWGGAVTVNGNVKVIITDPNGQAGAMAIGRGTIRINGHFDADPYIAFMDPSDGDIYTGVPVSYKTPADFVIPTTLKGYKTYAKWGSTVWVLDSPASQKPKKKTTKKKAMSPLVMSATGDSNSLLNALWISSVVLLSVGACWAHYSSELTLRAWQTAQNCYNL